METTKFGEKFSLTKPQIEQLAEWIKSLPKKQFGAIDLGYTFCFTPTRIGDIIKVKREDGHEIDLTDYDSF